MTGRRTVRVAAVSETGRPGGAQGSSPVGPVEDALDAGAELVLMPQLSFNRYFPAERDRDALELGERMPSGAMRQLLDGVDGGYIFASVYECVGEGVFYVRGELRAADGGEPLLWDRQRRVEAAPGRYEQMFFSPGHGPRTVAETPWGPAGILLGADLINPAAWQELANRGARLVLGGASAGDEDWSDVRDMARAMATAHGLACAVVNRGGDEAGFSGGAIARGADGSEVEPGGNEVFELELAANEEQA